MSDLERFNEIVDELWELVFGTVRRPEVKFKGMMKKATDDKDWETVRSGEDRRSKDRGTSDRRLNGTKLAIKKEYNLMMKRARNADGKFKADDKSTKDFNEAWVGGKAPKKKKRKK